MRRFRLAAILAPLALSGCLYRAAWAPDGKSIAYLRAGALWVTDLEGRHTRIADAMVSGDVAAAERRMRRHLETVLRYLTDEENGAAAPPRRRVKARAVPSAAS